MNLTIGMSIKMVLFKILTENKLEKWISKDKETNLLVNLRIGSIRFHMSRKRIKLRFNKDI